MLTNSKILFFTDVRKHGFFAAILGDFRQKYKNKRPI
jgi:hypothetical protein